MKYIKTFGERDTTELLMKKVDELVAAYASLKASHAALAAKLNLDAANTALDDTDYADSSLAAPATAVSELE